MTKKTARVKQINVRLHDDLYNTIKKISKKQGKSMAGLCRDVMRNFDLAYKTNRAKNLKLEDENKHLCKSIQKNAKAYGDQILDLKGKLENMTNDYEMARGDLNKMKNKYAKLLKLEKSTARNYADIIRREEELIFSLRKDLAKTERRFYTASIIALIAGGWILIKVISNLISITNLS